MTRTLRKSRLRCALVSAAFAALMPLLSGTIALTGAEDAAIDPGAAGGLQIPDDIGPDGRFLKAVPTPRH